jgi:hypothetical protein
VLTLTLTRPAPPAPLPQWREWLAATVAWWEDLWGSPMATEFDRSDMHGLLALAVLMDDFWRAEDPQLRARLAAEVRLQRQCYGLSPIDRRRLQWEIDRGEEADIRTATRRSSPKRSTRRGMDPYAVGDPSCALAGPDAVADPRAGSLRLD